MSNSESDVIIRLPEENSGDLRELWREARIASGYAVNYDLENPELAERFDAAALAEWLVPMAEHVPALLSAVLGYLVAKRGEVEFGPYKFKNMSAEDIEKIIQLVKKYNLEDGEK